MDFRDKDFGKILKNNAQTQRHELLPRGTECFRVYDRNLQKYPVTVDIYGKHAKVTDFGEEGPMDDETKALCLDICSRMLYLEPQNIVYSYRVKRDAGQQHEKTELEAKRFTVHENGHLFTVDLTTYVDTGLFLDHAVTRSYIESKSNGCDVLNLFSYTGSFSVYAAAGLAKSVTSVDMSATYTRWAEENLSQNGYSGDNYRCICQDAGKYIRTAVEKGLKYDIIIFDPPSFSNSHKMEKDFDVARDYAAWIKDLSQLLTKHGFIIFSTNLGTFSMDRRKLRRLCVREITGALAAPGFVKDRKGTVRSWIMAFDDEMLSLDWSEPEKKEESRAKKTEEKKYERKDYSERRPGSEGRYGSSREYGKNEWKPGYDKPRYEKGSGRNYEKRDFGKRDFDRKPRYEKDGFEKRSYDRPRYDRPRYDREGSGRDFEKRDFGKRDFDRKPRYEKDGFEKRSYDRPRYDRPRYDREGSGRDFEKRDFGKRDFDRKPGYEKDGFEKRSYDRPRYDRPRYDREGSGRDFEKRDFGKRDFDRKPGYGEDRPRRNDGYRNSDSRTTKKPYGYDFKPARSRNDNSDFFWNEEDLNK